MANSKQLPYYELHITMIGEGGEEFKKMIEWFVNPFPITLNIESLGFLSQSKDSIIWKYSEISDDIILGPGKNLYLTTHIGKGRKLEWVEEYLDTVVNGIILQGIPVIRSKIEVVVRDKIFKLTEDRKRNILQEGTTIPVEKSKG